MPSPEPTKAIDERAALLVSVIDRELRKWVLLAAAWGVAYAAFLIVTVAFPVIIASKDGLKSSILGDVTPYVPLLAVATAVVIAADQIVHIQTMWLWYRSDRRLGRQLKDDIVLDPPTSDAELEKYHLRWRDLDNLNGTHTVGGGVNVEPKAKTTGR